MAAGGGGVFTAEVVEASTVVAMAAAEAPTKVAAPTEACAEGRHRDAVPPTECEFALRHLCSIPVRRSGVSGPQLRPVEASSCERTLTNGYRTFAYFA